MTKLKNLLILCLRCESKQKEQTTKAGIIIPLGMSSKSNLPIRAVVKEIGGGLPSIPMEVEIGDIVIYKHDVIITKVDGMDLVAQNDLILVEDEE